MKKNDYVTRVRSNHKHLEVWRVEDVYEIAKRELFITLYSCNTSLINENTEIPYIYEYKVLEAMEEIINMGTMRHFTSYQENGWSWTRPSNGLQAYRNLKAKVGVC